MLSPYSYVIRNGIQADCNEARRASSNTRAHNNIGLAIMNLQQFRNTAGCLNLHFHHQFCLLILY